MVVSLGRLASKVQCRFTSTETIIRTIRDGEPRTATSTFTQFLSSDPEIVSDLNKDINFSQCKMPYTGERNTDCKNSFRRFEQV